MGQLPHLAQAYERYKDKGFEILSYSMDEEKQALADAIARHGLKWLQAVDPKHRGFEDPIAKSMFVWGIPTAYLVAADGTILARDWEIKDGKLEEFLERALSGQSPSGGQD